MEFPSLTTEKPCCRVAIVEVDGTSPVFEKMCACRGSAQAWFNFDELGSVIRKPTASGNTTFYEVETGRRKVAHIFLLCCGPQNSFYISTI
jgi:hypothetical protein